MGSEMCIRDRCTLALAGIDITKYSAHSTRAASVLPASRANVNIDDILQLQAGRLNAVLLVFTTNMSLRFQAMPVQCCHLCKCIIYTLPLNRHVVVSSCPCCFEVSWDLSAS